MLVVGPSLVRTAGGTHADSSEVLTSRRAVLFTMWTGGRERRRLGVHLVRVRGSRPLVLLLQGGFLSFMRRRRTTFESGAPRVEVAAGVRGQGEEKGEANQDDHHVRPRLEKSKRFLMHSELLKGVLGDWVRGRRRQF